MPTKEILMVEDNPGDIVLLREALQQTGGAPRLTVVHDGVSALELLRDRAAMSPPQLPELVLLDLNLPRLGGWEVLGCMRQDPALCAQPVMILTGATTDRQRAAAYGLPPERYLVKPDTFQGFLEIAGRVAGCLSEEVPP